MCFLETATDMIFARLSMTLSTKNVANGRRDLERPGCRTGGEGGGNGKRVRWEVGGLCMVGL